jgi:hypothetical protein
VHLYICADQQFGQWLIRAIDNHRLESGARLKATVARNLLKPVKVALRTRDKVAQTQVELLKWIKNLNSGLHTEHWRVLDKQSEQKGQRLILFIDQDSLTAIKRTGYKIFTGFSHGTVKVLKDPEAHHHKEEGVVLVPASLKSVSEGEGDDIPTPSDDQRGAVERKVEIPLKIKYASADQGIPSKGTRSDKRERAKEERWRQTPPLMKRKNEIEKTHTL